MKEEKPNAALRQLIAEKAEQDRIPIYNIIQRLGVSDGFFYMVLSGRRSPPDWMANQLSEILGISRAHFDTLYESHQTHKKLRW